MRIDRVVVNGTDEDAMQATLRLIGKAIRKGSTYLPIRNYAAAIASTAAPKDYLGQVKAIYDTFVSRWRYVKDPVTRELVSFSPPVLYKLVMGADGRGAGQGYGVGDCDCASAAIGSMLESIGIPVRLATTADPRAAMGGTFGHVFVQAHIPKMGWMTVDPVLYPSKPLGATANHSRLAIWDLDGKLLAYQGNYNPRKKKARSTCTVLELLGLLDQTSRAFRAMRAC